MNELYKYSQKCLKERQTADIMRRHARIRAMSRSDKTSFSEGAIVEITGKESSDLWRVMSLKSRKTGYADTLDLELLPCTKEEYEIGKRDLEYQAAELGKKIEYFEDTNAEEFDVADFTAWNIVKALKANVDQADIRKQIVQELKNLNTVTS